MSESMQFFEGFIERVERSGDTVLVRLAAGDFDPAPQSPPVVLVRVVGATEVDALHTTLLQVQEVDDYCCLEVFSNGEAMLTTDHGSEIALRGPGVSITEARYDERDFERLAKQNHEWGMSQHQALKKQSERLQSVRELLFDQQARLTVKIQGHAEGSTARTLYEQHLSFLARVLAESDN